jgi:hypothetical protein
MAWAERAKPNKTGMSIRRMLGFLRLLARCAQASQPNLRPPGMAEARSAKPSPRGQTQSGFSAKPPAGVERDTAGGDMENGARHGRYHPDAEKE